MLKQILLVGLGGGVGSILRFLTSTLLFKHNSSFPIGTFVANILGCLVIGLFVGLSFRYDFVNKELRHLLIVGFCGGYTTFSTFSLENIELINAGSFGMLAFYTVASVAIGILAVWTGIMIVK